jgi:hypothetical protein
MILYSGVYKNYFFTNYIMSAEGQELNLDNIIDQDQDRLTTDELIAQAEKD